MLKSATATASVAGDDGFSLVEAVVALAIATAIFTALAFALVGGAKAGLLSQQNQQAGDVLNKAVEDARNLTYASLRMRALDLNVGEATGATRSPAIGTCLCYNPTSDTTSGAGVEPLVATDPNGAIDQHVKPVTLNGGNYLVRRYVTVPADASGAVYKRLTVVVTWNGLGKQRTRTYSTLIAESKRGLPLPDFKFTNAGPLSQCRNPGSQTVYTFTLKNNGARDSWAVTNAPVGPSWAYHADMNGNGSYDEPTDTVLPSTAGGPVTGLLEPTTSRKFFAVQTLTGAAAPYSMTTVFRATSVAQPVYFQELTAVTSVQTAPCGAVAVPTTSSSPSASASPSPASSGPVPLAPAASCAPALQTVTTSVNPGTMIRYYPGNSSAGGNTAAQTGMPVVRDGGSPPASGPLYNYSTGIHAAAGRVVDTTAATWTYSMPAASQLKGRGEVTLWAATPAATPAGTTSTPVFQVVLERLNSVGNLISTLSSATFTTPSSGWGCAGFRAVSIALDAPNGGETVEQNDKLRLSVRVTSGGPMRLAYDTAAYPMTMTLPYKSGNG